MRSRLQEVIKLTLNLLRHKTTVPWEFKAGASGALFFFASEGHLPTVIDGVVEIIESPAISSDLIVHNILSDGFE